MTCCIQKARIYYKEPIGFRLTYSGSANGEVLAQEPLISNCIETRPQIPANLYALIISYSAVSVDWRYFSFTENDTRIYQNLTAPISVYTETQTRSNWYGRDVIHHNLFYEDANAQHFIDMQAGSGGYAYRESINYSWYVTRMDQQLDPAVYTFKVIGEETGTIYREIGGLEECPAVDNLGCVMGEEKHVDVEMGKGLPLLPLFVPDCLLAFAGFPLPPNTIQIRKISLAIPNTKPGKVKLPQPVLTLTGLPDCPAEYRIVCCPDGECEPERCPPDTDCELDCGSFVCCYKNGKVIKTVRK